MPVRAWKETHKMYLGSKGRHLRWHELWLRTFGAPHSLMCLNHALTGVAIEFRLFGPKILRLLEFEPLLQSGNRHLELTRLDHRFIVGADKRKIIRA